MKLSNILLIVGVVGLLGVAALFLKPEKLTETEEENAVRNRKEIIKSLEGAEGDTALIDSSIIKEHQDRD